MFFFVFFINMAVNLDHGAIPAATKILKVDLNLDNQQLGTLGSLVFIGLTLGSLTATFIVSILPYKVILSLSYLGNGIGLLAFSYFEDYKVQCFARLVSGFFQVSRSFIYNIFRFFIQFIFLYGLILFQIRKINQAGCL